MTTSVPDPEILAGFIDEAGQCIATLTEKLLAAEGGDCSQEIVGEMFRAAHSMKGAAGFLNLSKVAKITHHLETVLDRVRKGKLEFDSTITDALFMALDTISALLADLAAGKFEATDIDGAIEALEKILGEDGSSAKKSADPCDDLGEVPEFLKGKLSVDDVLETLIAQKAGDTPWVLLIPLEDIYACKCDPIDLYHALEKSVKIQTAFSLIESPADIWGELQDYHLKIAVLCFCRTDVFEVIKSLSLPVCLAYELCREDGLKPPVEIKNDIAVSVGERCDRLVVKSGMEKHLQTWVSETQDELFGLDSLLMDYENSSCDSEKLNEIFRLMHRVKGSCASMGLEEMARIAHNCESLLEQYRNGSRTPSECSFKTLFMAKDYLSNCMECVVTGKDEAPDSSPVDELFEALFVADSTDEVCTELPCCQDLSENQCKMCADAVTEGMSVWKVYVELEPDSPLADLRYGMVLKNLDSVGAILAAYPSLKELEAGIDSPPPLRTLVAGSDEKVVTNAAHVDMVAKLIVEKADCEWMKKNILAPAKVECEKGAKCKAQTKSAGPANAGSAIQDTVRVDISRLDYLINVAGELAITKARINQLSEGLASQMRTMDTRAIEFLIWNAKQTMGNNGSSSLSSESIRNAEQWLTQMKSAQDNAVRLRDTAIVLHRHTSSIQNCVMQVRMVPIGPLFQRFHRLVRDVCKNMDRQATLVTKGENTELDKKLIDELADPLTHLIRNAVDHGLESPEERKKNGKPEAGSIFLEAFHEGSQICVRISDDGKGLNKEKICEKAISSGVATESALQKMSDQEIYSLIFQPGFSTAAKVTNISGRGVGMDIVKSKINELKGKIDIESRPGQGASFTIRLPLTLAIIDALLVKIGSGRFAISLESVKEIVEIDGCEVHETEGGGRVMTLRNDVIAFVEPSKILGLDGEVNYNKKIRAVIIRTSGGQIAFVVDAVIGKEEIVVKPLSEEFGDVQGVSGATVLGDGGIALILEAAVIGDLSKVGGYDYSIFEQEEAEACLAVN